MTMLMAATGVVDYDYLALGTWKHVFVFSKLFPKASSVPRQKKNCAEFGARAAC